MNFKTKLVLVTLLIVSFWNALATAAEPSTKIPKNMGTPKGAKIESCLSLSAEACDLFRMTNQVRTAQGIPALMLDPKCQKAADAHVADMARRKYYGHLNPEGKGMAQRYPGLWFTIGENIVMGTKMDNAGAIQAWMKSKGHRRNMLDRNFTHLGIGRLNANGEHYFLQCFSKPRSEFQGGPVDGAIVNQRNPLEIFN